MANGHFRDELPPYCVSALNRSGLLVAELERAVQLLDERGVLHGEITDLGDAFRL